MKNTLEDKVLEPLYTLYNNMHTRFPLATNYLSTAVGTVGGDIVAKQFTGNPTVRARDIAFTATAAIGYSYLAPKMIEWSTALTHTLSNSWKKLKNTTSHLLFNTALVTTLYFPVNMVYWNYLSLKNEEPLTLDNNLIGAATLGIATIPYLFADYVAIKRFSQPETKKYLRPFYSAVELVWNALFAGGNYFAKKL
ncbi:MAG: hypothetical protein Q8L34_05370 [Candidatus Woesearchaeota archaeon]|nr:hypothetical protein [Candidatus Woesearchaeota archaeon]